MILLSGCQCTKASSFEVSSDQSPIRNVIDDNYRNYYQIFVSSFADSNQDGIGDLRGIISKLEFLSDMGYTGIYLTPIFLSSSYHKYDIKDYFTIVPSFGTMEDLKELVSKAHSLDMKVILDGVFNHSSINHPYFEKALLAHQKKLQGLTLSEDEDYYEKLYVLIDDKSEMKSNRKYSKAGANDFYYECNFSTEMPEFDFENESVYSLIQSIVDYYMSDDIKVDGFRLDAVLYYDYMNTSENIKILNRIAKMVHDHDGYVIGECFSDEKTITEYYQSDVDSFFYFPGQGMNGFINQSLGFMGDNKKKYLNGLEDMVRESGEHIPACFLDNHDVPRLSKSGNKRMNKFLLGLRDMANGCTFNYYGDEIGMSSSNIDFSSDYQDSNYRTHYYWDDDNHEMETSDPIHSLSQIEAYPAMESQAMDENSILNYEKKALSLRNRYPSIARGEILVSQKDSKINESDETKLLVFDKKYQDERIRFVFNFSGYENESYDLDGLTLVDILLSDTDETQEVSNGKLIIPPYCIALLK